MLLEGIVHCRDKFWDVWGENSSAAPQDPKKFAISEILQMKLAIGEMGLTSPFFQLACVLVWESVVSSDTFYRNVFQL